jgi:hypothetical protein
MRIDAYLRAARAASLVLFTVAMPAVAGADTDACTLLTAAQVTAAVGVTVAEGQHVTPTFVKTCTWSPSGSSDVKSVTLNLQTAATYDGGKRMAVQMAAASTGGAVQAASVGEDAYYFVAGDQVGLLVKKGGSSFKVAVYATLPVEKKEALELALAKQVAAKL